ncbi:hypothetical protein C8A01DRAFT_34134 [Parachaetomium inaequale]|uniref:Uncharacterized protein n=1 Tax=Parachaetomium inaequale TaxID=2588326 RepID=A0AAN6STM9_9PEZI|nr:hypothetical protein C8A01DRAFT_34134 [Parachaetomium inaequale]
MTTTTTSTPPPTFGPIPQHLWDKSPPLKDTSASGSLSVLNQYIRGPRGRAHGSWGYTILRTAYGPESDALFAVALERLKSQVYWWGNHTGRFSAFGALCEEYRVDYDEPNQELFRRFYVEVIEDKEGLAHLDGGADEARFTALGEYFRRWVAGVETGWNPEKNPRFCVCLVLDSESVASLAALPEELPPLRCAVDLEEKRQFLGTGAGAWVWLLETDYIADPELDEDEELDEDDEYRGWMRMDVHYIQLSWFSRLGRGRSGKRRCFGHEEREQGSGIYWFAE